MERRERLLHLIRERLDEQGDTDACELGDDDALISSGRLDSLAVLHLAEWIDDELGGALDLDATDIEREWDSVASILAFLERSR